MHNVQIIVLLTNRSRVAFDPRLKNQASHQSGLCKKLQAILAKLDMQWDGKLRFGWADVFEAGL